MAILLQEIRTNNNLIYFNKFMKTELISKNYFNMIYEYIETVSVYKISKLRVTSFVYKC